VPRPPAAAERLGGRPTESVGSAPLSARAESELSFSKGELHQRPGSAVDPELTVRTSSAFLDRWAAGDAGWDDGLATGEVMIDGREGSWLRWQVATGYLQSYEPEGTDE
jgi:hypothetical protein